MSVTTLPSRGIALRQPGWIARLFDYKPFLIVMCLAPAIGLLTVFLTYPLGLGVWLATPWPARFSLRVANSWRGIPFVAITLLAGLQTTSPSLSEAAMPDGASAWQRFRYITLPMMMPILAIVMTFSIIFTFPDFQ